MTHEEAKEAVRAFMQRTGESPEAIAQALHPDMTAEDVTRYLADAASVDAGGRGFSIDELMAKFAVSIEEVEEEHTNDLA